MAKIECTKCSLVIHVSSDEIPDEVQQGEWFEWKCPKCDEGHYMELTEDDRVAESDAPTESKPDAKSEAEVRRLKKGVRPRKRRRLNRRAVR